MGKREDAHKKLTAKLLAVAVDRVEKFGLEQLRARDVTNDAGCALGTLYKCYDDLDDLIIHVNSKTFGLMKKVLGNAGSGISDPADALKALALAYLDFATQNKNLWSAVFKHRMHESETTPEWHQQENMALLELIAKPMGKIYPDFDNQQLQVRSRTYFAAVHGIVSISFQDRFISLSGNVLRIELEHFVERLAS